MYKNQTILLFREAWAMEKCHGSSSHVGWNDNQLSFFSGGESHDRFKSLFDQSALTETFQKLGHQKIVVYGEVYGGKCQGMKDVYGPDLRFIAFDVQIGDSWLNVPDMAEIATLLGIEVVPYSKVSTDIAVLDALRDAPSEIAVRRGMGVQLREGIVLRPLIEMTMNNGERVICKHKGGAFSERVHVPKVSPDKLEVVSEANDIAIEWVTVNRLINAKSHFKEEDWNLSNLRNIIIYIVEDVRREASSEIIWTRDVERSVSKKVGILFKKMG
jgi:hypothetical protein